MWDICLGKLNRKLESEAAIFQIVGSSWINNSTNLYFWFSTWLKPEIQLLNEMIEKIQLWKLSVLSFSHFEMTW